MAGIWSRVFSRGHALQLLWFALQGEGLGGTGRDAEAPPEARNVQLLSPEELQGLGVSVADIEQVEAVHNAGEITKQELPSRLF